MVTHSGGPNRLTLKSLPDDLWVGVKGQSNSEIARSPRNAFRAACIKFIRGRATDWMRGFTAYQIPPQTPNANKMFLYSEGMGAKVHVREGKNPDHQLRSQMYAVEKRGLTAQTARMLAWEAAIHLKSA